MPRLRTSLPTLNLEQVDLLSQASCPAHDYFHLFGIFRKEDSFSSGVFWTLFDEFKEIKIRQNGDLSTYLKPKAGDIVRLHRVKINSNKQPEIQAPNSVVIWKGFDADPQPLTTARHPTINDDDKQRCKALQKFYSSKITRIGEMNGRAAPGGILYLMVAGRLDHRSVNAYGHLELKFSDGTGEQQLTVYAKDQTKSFEDDAHFIIARELELGDYFTATNVKYDRSKKTLQLSANLQHGRSFRLVHKDSTLGLILSTSLAETNSQENLHIRTSETVADDRRQLNGSQNSDRPAGRRKSPRLSQKQNDSQNSEVEPPPQAIDGKNLQSRQVTPLRSSPPSVNLTHPTIDDRPGSVDSNPKYTKFSEIKQRGSGYDFYDIVGQVRAEPKITATFGNCLLQIYDGSDHNYKSFYELEVEKILPGCLIMQVYSKQKDTDTAEHFERAKRLKEGELIYVKNVRASFISGKLRLELSANKSHDKSINVIDKDSIFGRNLLSIVENPIVEGINEPVESDSQTTQDTDHFLMDISS